MGANAVTRVVFLSHALKGNENKSQLISIIQIRQDCVITLVLYHLSCHFKLTCTPPSARFSRGEGAVPPKVLGDIPPASEVPALSRSRPISPSLRTRNLVWLCSDFRVGFPPWAAAFWAQRPPGRSCGLMA